jgi:hypothetical protein
MTAVDRVIAVAAGFTVAVLAGVAGAISYSHMGELARLHGEVGWRAHALDGPVAADVVGQLGRAGLGGGEAGDGVDGDGAPFLGFWLPTRRVMRMAWTAWGKSSRSLDTRPIYHHKRDPIEAHLTIVLTALAISRWIGQITCWSIRKFVRTARRYRTIEIQSGAHTITASDPLPDDLRHALDRIHHSLGAH